MAEKLTPEIFSSFLHSHPKKTQFDFDIDGTLIPITDPWCGNIMDPRLALALIEINKITNNGVGFVTARQEDNLKDYISHRTFPLDPRQVSLVAAVGRSIIVHGKKAPDISDRIPMELLEKSTTLWKDYKTVYPEHVFDLQFSLDAKGLHALELLTKAPAEIKEFFLADVMELLQRFQTENDDITEGPSGRQLLRASAYKDKAAALRYVQQQKRSDTLCYAGDSKTDVTSIAYAVSTGGLGIVVGHEGKFNTECMAVASHYVENSHKMVKLLCQSVGVTYNLNDVLKPVASQSTPLLTY